MNLIKTLFAASTKAATPTLGREITPEVLNGKKIVVQNNTAILYSTAPTELIRQSYLSNTDVYAIINYILHKALRAKYFQYEVKDEKALHDMRLLKGDGATAESLKQAAKLRTKALVNSNHPQIAKLLVSPNPYQTFKSLTETAIAYKLLTGERFIQKVEGLNPVTDIYILPPTMMDVKAGDNYMQIGGYTHTPTRREFAPEEINFSRTFYPALDGYGAELRGLSPLQVMALQIQKSNEGVLSGVRQYQNGGPPGLLSLWDEQVPLTPEQALQYEATLSRRSGSHNRGRVNITGMHGEWIKMGLSPVDLDILQSGVFDLQALARGYKIDSVLVNDKTSSTYNNMAEARKAGIVDAVVPVVEDFADDLNNVVRVYNTGGKTYFIDADVSHFPEMAEDLNTLADRLDKIPLTLNEKREAMQYERIDAPGMDEVWVGNDRTPLSQFMEPAPATGGAEGSNDGTY